MNIKKSLHTLFIFVISIFLISGLSYLYTKTASSQGTNPPVGNTFVPINEGTAAQLRCVANNTKDELDPNSTYSLCKSGARLYTNGLFIKNTNTFFYIDGDPQFSAPLNKGALFVGCTTDTTKVSQSVIDNCNNTNSSPNAYFNGDIILDQLIGSSERQLCISNTGKVVVCQ